MLIGLGCTKQVGKDTAAAHLVKHYGFTRLAFADPIRMLLNRVDPWVGWHPLSWHLKQAESVDPWDDAKRHPRVRQMLVDLGVGARELVSDDVWLRPVLHRAATILLNGGRVVVTDVRFWNEVDGLRSLDRGAVFCNVVRPGSPPADPESEPLAGGDWHDFTLVNDGTVEDLHVKVDRWMKDNT